MRRRMGQHRWADAHNRAHGVNRRRRAGELADDLAFVAPEIVHDHDIAGAKRDRRTFST